MDWIGCGSAFTSLSRIELDWGIKLVDWFGLDLRNWTNVQHWVTVLRFGGPVADSARRALLIYLIDQCFSYTLR